LLRIIKTPEGNIEIDVTGKKSGRGAYLCYNKECFEKAAKKGKLNNALKVEISPETIKLLKEKFNELKNTSL
jgi:predicted RNA-binding protein YlxR (DUF448 family)